MSARQVVTVCFERIYYVGASFLDHRIAGCKLSDFVLGIILQMSRASSLDAPRASLLDVRPTLRKFLSNPPCIFYRRPPARPTQRPGGRTKAGPGALRPTLGKILSKTAVHLL